METLIKNPIEIIQELLAIFSTRNESAAKLKTLFTDGNTVSQLAVLTSQSNEYMYELMNELSNYGDGVMASVDHDNEYLNAWKEALPNLEHMALPELQQVVLKMESKLKKIYRDALAVPNELPPSLTDLLNRQFSRL